MAPAVQPGGLNVPANFSLLPQQQNPLGGNQFTTAAGVNATSPALAMAASTAPPVFRPPGLQFPTFNAVGR